jgi:hypothetical protein
MIRFTLLRIRGQAAIALGALLVVAVVALVTGLRLANVYNTTIAPCQRHQDCVTAQAAFPGPYGTMWGLLGALIIAVPGVIGIFWGAPLAAREFETGTFRLAWTQGVSRTRWLAVKIGVVGALGMLVAGLLTLLVTWWTSPIQAAQQNRMDPAVFHNGGLVPIGYAALAFTLGVTAGLLIRRTLPAMAVTLVIFAAVQLAFPAWVRPHLIPPARSVSALNLSSVVEYGVRDAGQPGGGQLLIASYPWITGAWILSSAIITPAGLPASTEPATAACGASMTLQSCQHYVASLHLRQEVTYQPESRYWLLQWAETGCYLLVSLLLAGLCLVRIRGRRPVAAGLGRWPDHPPVAPSPSVVTRSAG